jgi:hypothetical protein
MAQQEATMARPLPRPLTELDKYRWDLETRAWVERMQHQPPKAREPEKPMEQMTIRDTDGPMMTRKECRRRLLAENARRTTS